MPNKVTWKKGMRLTTEVFNAMDAAHEDGIELASRLASGGRYGLFPSASPFELSVNISNNMLEVLSLSCHGITRSGKIVDIDFDSNYSHTSDTRIAIPAANNNEAFLLAVRVPDNQWREVDEMYSEAAYTFELVGENSRLDDNCLLIGCIVNQYGWRLNETDFVPPCLYINAHYKFVEQLEKALRVFRAIWGKCLSAQHCVARSLLASLWRAASDSQQRLDKERDTLTPAQLYSTIQQLVGSFLIGCSLDEYVSLENQDSYVAYAQRSYDARNLYRDIEIGLSLCAEIELKMDVICSMTEVKPAPVEPQAPKPAPEPEIAGRNRWAGLVI